MSSSSLLDCKKCQKGTYSTATGASVILTCNPCPPGKKSDVLGATSSQTCQDCEKGKASEAGAVECPDCTIGRYTLGEGSASCQSCGAGSFGIGCKLCRKWSVFVIN